MSRFVEYCWIITYFSLEMHVRRSNSFTMGRCNTRMVIIRSYQNEESFPIPLELKMFNTIKCGKRSYNLPVNKNKYAAEVMPKYIFEKTSFHKVVQHFAQLHDLLFQPKTSGTNTSTKDGKQIFYFRIVPVYFDSDVEFALIKDSKKRKAKFLEQLLELNDK